MSDKPQIKLAETVVLIDAAFLNFVITDIKGYFEETLHRSLQEIDLSMLTTYITCLLYTSDAADDLLCVNLVGRRYIKKKKR